MDRIYFRPVQIYASLEEEVLENDESKEVLESGEAKEVLESGEAKEVLESKGEESNVPPKKVKRNLVSDEELLNCLKREHEGYMLLDDLSRPLRLEVFDRFPEFLEYYRELSLVHKSSLLQSAIGLRLPQTALFLIRKGADLGIRDRLDRTALHYAVRYLYVNDESLEVVRQLIDEGCDLEVKDLYEDYTALGFALKRCLLKGCDTKLAKLLIEKGAKVPDEVEGLPVLHVLARFNDAEIFKLAVEKKRDAFSKKHRVLGSVLHHAVYSFSYNIIKYLLENHLKEIRENHMDSLIEDWRGRQVPLLQVPFSKEKVYEVEYDELIPLINLLLQYGYGLEDRNQSGQSLLQYVSENMTGRHALCVNDPGSINALLAFLIRKGADVFSRDNDGYTVMRDTYIQERLHRGSDISECVYREILFQNYIIFNHIPNYYVSEEKIKIESLNKIRDLLDEHLWRDIAEEVVSYAYVPSEETKFRSNGEQIDYISAAGIRTPSLWIDGVQRGAEVRELENNEQRLVGLEQIKEGHFEKIKNCRDFHSIRMNYVTVEKGFCLGGSPSTKNLELRGTYLQDGAVTGALPQEIRKMVNLENVVLECLTDEILESLKGCENLKNLGLVGCPISRNQLRDLMEMKLDTLMIAGVDLTEDDYRYIQHNARNNNIRRFIGEILVEDEVQEILYL